MMCGRGQQHTMYWTLNLACIPSLFSNILNCTLWNPLAGVNLSRNSKKSKECMVSRTDICSTSIFMIATMRSNLLTTTPIDLSWSSGWLKSSQIEFNSCNICLNHSSYTWWMMMNRCSSWAGVPPTALSGCWRERRSFNYSVWITHPWQGLYSNTYP